MQRKDLNGQSAKEKHKKTLCEKASKFIKSMKTLMNTIINHIFIRMVTC